MKDLKVGTKVVVIEVEEKDTRIGLSIGDLGVVSHAYSSTGIVDVKFGNENFIKVNTKNDWNSNLNSDGSYSMFFSQVKEIDSEEEFYDGGFLNVTNRRNVLRESSFNQVLKYSKPLKEEAVKMIIEALLADERYNTEVEIKTKLDILFSNFDGNPDDYKISGIWG